MPRIVSADDPLLRWPGAISLEYGDDWVSPCRLRVEERSLIEPALYGRAQSPAGVRIAFRSDTQSIRGSLVPEAFSKPLDVVCDGEPVDRLIVSGRDYFHTKDLPAGNKLIELWLPHNGPVRLRHMEFDDDPPAISESAPLSSHHDFAE